MADPSPTEFLISKMEDMDDVTQVLIVTRKKDVIAYDFCGGIAADVLGMVAFVDVFTREHLRRELYDEEMD